MGTLTACVLLSQDPALHRHVAGSLEGLASVAAIPAAREAAGAIRRTGATVLLLDLRAESALACLPGPDTDTDACGVVALGTPRTDPWIAAELADIHALEPLTLDPARLRRVVRQAAEAARLAAENRILRDTSAGRSQLPPTPGRPDPLHALAPLQHFARAFRHLGNTARLLDHIIEGIADVATVARAGIVARTSDDPSFRLRAGVRCIDGTAELEYGPDHPLAAWMQVHAHVLGRSALPRVDSPAERLLLTRALDAVGAEVLVPLHGSRRLIGWLFLGHRATGLPFEPPDLEALMTVADHAATLIENAMLYEEIAVQKTLAETLLGSVPTGIVAVSADAAIRCFNQAAEEIFGLQAAATIGRPAEAAGSVLADLLRRTLESGAPPPVEVADPASRRYLSIQVRRLDAGRDCLGAVAFVHDLTRERLLREKQEELERATFWTDLAAAMSHEIRNPLVAISTFAQLLPEQYADPEFRERFRDIVTAEIARLNTIITQINAFAHPKPIECRDLDLAAVLRRAVARARAAVPAAKHAGVQVSAPPGLRLPGDEESLTECFAALVTNALEALAGREAGRIAVHARRAGTETAPLLVAAVTDDGPGIAAPLRDKVFSPFCTTKARGLGLGLPIARRAATDHGGHVEIETGEGGTAVTVTLPIRKPEEFSETHPGC